MAKQLQLTIPEPCHENWEAMTPVEKGRFCGACQKQVVDFSNMNDRQVAEFFKKPSTGSVCGRFMSTQLERDIEIPRKRIPWVKYFFQFALPAFLFSLKTSITKAQGTVKVNTAPKEKAKRGGFANEYITLGAPALIVCDKPLMGDTIVTKEAKMNNTQSAAIANNNKILSLGNADSSRGLVTGLVTDEKGDKLPGAWVRIKGARNNVVAGKDGDFEIMARKGDVLVVSGAGIEPTEVAVADSRHLQIVVKKKNVDGAVEVVITAGYVTPYISTKRRVCGFVTDESGKPMAGVWVISNKKKFIATTDEKGKFTYTVGKRDVLSFSSPATVGIDVTVGKKDTLYVQLKSIETPAGNINVINANAITVFPNPAKNGSPLMIEFNEDEEGLFQLQLLSQSGQSIHQQQVWIENKVKQVKIGLPTVAAGTYFLLLVNEKTGKKFNGKIVIN